MSKLQRLQSNIYALNYMIKPESGSWSKHCVFQLRTMVVNVSPHSRNLTLKHFNGDFSLNIEEKCSASDILLTDDLFPF